MTWTQHYTPVGGSLVASAALAALPVVVLLGLLAFFRVKAMWAALAGLATVVLAATVVYGMPVPMAAAAAAYGACYGLLPIGWILANVVFLYEVTVSTGQFEIVKQSIAGVSGDRRIQALLIAFSFGAFIEGAAGFGAPVAISAAMLIGIGFRPMLAAMLALMGNTAPVAFGSLGTPIIALAQVTGLPLEDLSAMAGRQLPVICLLVPFWLIAVMAGWRRMLEVWPACLTAGGCFGATQFLMSNFHGPWLVDTASALASIAGLLVLLRFWRPRSAYRFDTDAVSAQGPAVAPRGRRLLRAWMPWAILTVVVFIWALPGPRAALDGLWVAKFEVPHLHHAVQKAPPLVPAVRAEDARYTFNPLSATGTAPLVGGVIAALLLGLRPLAIVRLYFATAWRLRASLLTISAMVALAFVSRYGGLDSTLGLALASTGMLFPFFSPLLGWLGVALTGSDTSSNVLFGNLQQVTAAQVDMSPVLAASANTTGGVMGKMISAPSLVVACATAGQPGQEGAMLRLIFWHSLALVTVLGLLVFVQAHALSWMIP